MATINWTNEARSWLKSIHNFIALDNPSAARKTIDGIVKKTELLKDFPEIGYKYLDLPDRNFRIFLYGHYRITYLIKSDNTIDIIGVFHGALDIKKYIENK